MADVLQYHDDGEDTLGPTVAAESSGSTACFNIRLKPNFWCGTRDKAGKNYDPDQSVHPLCFQPETRRTLNAMAPNMNQVELKAKAKELLKDNGCKAQPPVILKMKLRHGDIMVMHGADMQKFFEASGRQMPSAIFADFE